MAPRTSSTGPGSRPPSDPTLRVERRLLRTHGTLLAIDECGRGALSGPVFCGAVLIGDATPRYPHGLRDSKLLSARRREDLVPQVRTWALASGTGSASAEEIDRYGILAALRLAALRAAGALLPVSLRPGVILLDGPHDWISTESSVPGHGFSEITGFPLPQPTVVTRVRGDRECAALAAASVLAKVARDALMVDLDNLHPGYGWSVNKGYASPAHIEALRRLGPSTEHRRSWNLPGVGE